MCSSSPFDDIAPTARKPQILPDPMESARKVYSEKLESGLNRRTFVKSSLGLLAPLSAATSSPVAVEGRRAAVACDPEPCARAALEAIEAGGNAMDAAAVACLASCMQEPSAVDIGGYVTCAVVLEAKTGKVWSVDGNSCAPAKARADMYEILPKRAGAHGRNEDEYGCSVKNDANVDGALSVGVPGTLAGVGTLWERWGKLKWPQIIAPAQEMLEQGVAVSANLAEGILSRRNLLLSMPSAAEHFMPGGKPLEQGQIWHRPGMDWTLRRLAAAGWQDFYQGDIARRTAGYVQQLGGILTVADLQRYRVSVEPAIEASFASGRVYGALLANGGLTCLSGLLLLSQVSPPGTDDPMYWHLVAEILKLAWRDRLRYFGDPRKIDLDWRRFISSSYADERIAALKKVPQSVDRGRGPKIGTSPGTIHISTADAEGNLVAVTLSHGSSIGSCVTVPSTGISLGHGMSRFDPHPGLANSVGPGKRPLNNVCPTILRQPGRDVAFGLRGGRRIVSIDLSLAQQLLQGRSMVEVLESPRLHTEGYEPIEVTESMPNSLRRELARKGHNLRVVKTIAGAVNIAAVGRDDSIPRAAGSRFALAAG
jgi:gamma-glutamyltranspeptidase/glutathione hydrolase